MGMRKPDPYTLLLATLITEWPYYLDSDDGEQAIYLYRMPEKDHWMWANGFVPPCGVGKRAENSKLLLRLGEVDLVRISLLWQPDDSVEMKRTAYLGRDVRHLEWLDARNWLLSQTEGEPNEPAST